MISATVVINAILKSYQLVAVIVIAVQAGRIIDDGWKIMKRSINVSCG